MCPLNDAVTCAGALKEFGFENYILKNPSKTSFLKWLDFFVSKTSKHLVIFYNGHLNAADPFTFGDESVSNQLFLDHIQNLSGRLTLISDICKKSSIWDISHSRLPFPPGLVSLSAIADEERPQQGEKGQRGFFVSEVAKWLGKTPNISPKDLSFSLRKVMKKNGYSFVVGTSSEDLLLLPLFE
jgi:hypothetical protein